MPTTSTPRTPGTRCPLPEEHLYAATGTGETKYTFDLGNYHQVAGIQVPARVKLGGDTAESKVEIKQERALPEGYGRMVTFVIFKGVTGWLAAPSPPMVVCTLASASTAFMPDVTRAKIT